MIRVVAVLLLTVLVLGVGFIAGRETAASPEPSSSPQFSSPAVMAVWTPWQVRDGRVSPRLDDSRRARRPHRPLDRHPIRAVTLDTTAYCGTGNRTASGVWPQIGMAASNLFAFGQRLRVPGHGVVVVTDRVGWGSQLDLFFGSDPGCESRAVQFGRRSLLVEVLP